MQEEYLNKLILSFGLNIFYCINNIQRVRTQIIALFEFCHYLFQELT